MDDVGDHAEEQETHGLVVQKTGVSPREEFPEGQFALRSHGPSDVVDRYGAALPLQYLRFLVRRPGEPCLQGIRHEGLASVTVKQGLAGQGGDLVESLLSWRWRLRCGVIPNFPRLSVQVLDLVNVACVHMARLHMHT